MCLSWQNLVKQDPLLQLQHFKIKAKYLTADEHLLQLQLQATGNRPVEFAESMAHKNILAGIL